MTTQVEPGTLPTTLGEDVDSLVEFFENAPIGLHVTASDGTILRANRVDYETLGYTVDEYVGHNIIDFHADKGVITDILARLSRGEALNEYAARLRCKDGTLRDVVITSSARFENGEFVNTRCLTRDVTAERRNEQLTRLDEQRTRALLRALPALIVTTTPQGEIEDISESYAEYTGLTLDEAKDWAAHQVIHFDDFDRAMEAWSNALASGEPMQNEMRLRRHDGVYRWYLVEGTPLRDDDGKILRWVTVNIEIEDRKRAEMHERYLAETTARLVAPIESEELLVEIARLAVPTLADICAIGLFDDTAQTVRVETAGADEREAPHVAKIHLRGWLTEPNAEQTVAEAIGNGLPVFVPDFSPSFIAACAPNEEQRASALAIGGTSLIALPLLGRGRAIGMVTFAATRSKRRYSARDLDLLKEVVGRLSVAIENMRLFRDLEATAADLRRAIAVKDDFLGMVSHELRTPITTVMGNAEVLRRSFDAIEREARDGALEDIVEEAGRLNRIIDDLLVLARLDQGDELEREPIIVRRLVERLVEAHLRRHASRKIDLRESGAPVPILGAPAYLEHVIRNLLSNAEKYSPLFEPIDVRVERDQEEVRVFVLDRGQGVPEDERERIFEPFYRSPTSARRVGGIGVGLAVCRRIIEAQNGRIWVAPREGGGSEFGFALPLAEDDPLASD